MEALGINVGYLMLQVFCIIVLPLLIVMGIVYWLIQKSSLKKADIVTTISVTDEGLTIPKKLLPDAANFVVYQQKDKIILVAKSESSAGQ